MDEGESPFKVKILILGPVQSGKTTIANYLSDASEIIGGNYRPTQGVRIVEFESNDLQLHGEKLDAEVELWDCSGDKKFENYWPAIQKDAHGVILVCNPQSQVQMKEMEKWFLAFVIKRGIPIDNVIVLLHQNSTLEGHNQGIEDDYRLAPSMNSIQCVSSNIEQNGDNLRLEFNKFLCNVIAGLTDSDKN